MLVEFFHFPGPFKLPDWVNLFVLRPVIGQGLEIRARFWWICILIVDRIVLRIFYVPRSDRQSNFSICF